MRISFLVNDVAFVDYKTLEAIWGWEPTDHRLGGTEESIVKWGEDLVRRGHSVTVYKNGQTIPYMHEGVIYSHRDLYAGGHDVCINTKASEIAPLEPTFYLTNETDAGLKDLSQFAGIIWPSHWAADNIPVNNPNLYIVPHGYDHKEIYPGNKVLKQCLYASSPDRGLDALDHVWPLIVDQHPDAHLYVTYGARVGLPNTTYGEFSEHEMNELYRTSDLWLHPCSGGELFGISGIKAQAAGAVPVYFPTMALAETVRGGIACEDIRDMYFKLNDLIGNEEEKARLRADLATIHFDNWEDSTTKLLGVITRVLH